MEQGEVKFTYSGILMKDGKKTICVRFERGNGKNADYAEGSIPACKIDKHRGFSEEEIHQMEEYLGTEQMNIVNEAKKLNNILKWI